MFFNIFLTFLLVFFNGFFVAAEFAIVKVRLSQIEMKARSGSYAAKIARNLIVNLNAYLSACQLGITLASLALGWIGEPVVARIILDIVNAAGIQIQADLAHKIALPVAFAIITLLHIILGEVAPKSLAIQRSEKISLVVSIPLYIFYIIFLPIIKLINSLSNLLLRMIGFEPLSESEELHSAEELRYLIKESSKSGAIEDEDQRLIENVFEFSDTPIKQIMIPRGKIVAVEINMSSVEILDKIITEGYSRMPVYENSTDNIVGILNTKDLISIVCRSQEIILKDIIRKPYFVQENDKIDNILRDMQKNRIHLAVVYDEFGGTAGLVTLEDIIEEIVGEIQDEYDDEAPLVEIINDKEFIIKATAIINDINEILPVPLPESEEYETLGGFILSLTGRIPELNEELNLGNYNCIVLRRSKRHIELVRMKMIEVQQA